MTIGIDIGSQNIKVCRVHSFDGKPVLTGAIIAEHRAGDLSTFEGESQATRKLRDILRRLSVTTGEAIASVGSSRMFTQNFVFPPLTADELRGAMQLEVKQTVSTDLAGMHTDYQVLAEVENGQSEVMFVAVPDDAVGRLLRVSAHAGLELVAVDIDNLAIANCFAALEPDVEKQSAVLLNIGDRCTNITVMDAGKVRFVRNVEFGGDMIAQAIARRFGVDHAVAAEIQKQSFLWNSMGLNIKNVLRQCMPDLLEAVYRSIEYCMNRKRLLNVDRILLTGGGANLMGIDKFVSEVFGIDTERWNPLDYLDMRESDRKEFGNMLCVAIGLALRPTTV